MGGEEGWPGRLGEAGAARGGLWDNPGARTTSRRGGAAPPSSPSLLSLPAPFFGGCASTTGRKGGGRLGGVRLRWCWCGWCGRPCCRARGVAAKGSGVPSAEEQDGAVGAPAPLTAGAAHALGWGPLL